MFHPSKQFQNRNDLHRPMTAADAYAFHGHLDPRNHLNDNRYAFYPNDMYDPYNLDQKRVMMNQGRHIIGSHQLFGPEVSRGGKCLPECVMMVAKEPRR